MVRPAALLLRGDASEELETETENRQKLPACSFSTGGRPRSPAAKRYSLDQQYSFSEGRGLRISTATPFSHCFNTVTSLLFHRFSRFPFFSVEIVQECIGIDVGAVSVQQISRISWHHLVMNQARAKFTKTE